MAMSEDASLPTILGAVVQGSGQDDSKAKADSMALKEEVKCVADQGSAPTDSPPAAAANEENGDPGLKKVELELYEWSCTSVAAARFATQAMRATSETEHAAIAKLIVEWEEKVGPPHNLKRAPKYPPGLPVPGRRAKNKRPKSKHQSWRNFTAETGVRLLLGIAIGAAVGIKASSYLVKGLKK